MKIIALLFTFISLPFVANAQVDPGIVGLEAQGSEATISMGQTAELARFRLSNRSTGEIQLKRLRLRNYGSARLEESFENLIIEDANVPGLPIARPVYVEQKAVQFHFDDFITVPEGDSIVLSVKGRLIYARSGRTVKLGIQYEEDVDTRLSAADNFSLDCFECRGVRAPQKTLRGGGVYLNTVSPYKAYRYYGSRRTQEDISKYYRTPVTNTTYAQGAQSVTFFSTFIESRVGVTVDGLFLAVGSGSYASDKNGNDQVNDPNDFSETFTDFTLFVNGHEVDSTNDFEYRNGQLGLLFNHPLELPANAQIMLTGRITHDAVTGDKVKFKLEKSGLIDPVYAYQDTTFDLVNLRNFEGSFSLSVEDSGTLSIHKR